MFKKKKKKTICRLVYCHLYLQASPDSYGKVMVDFIPGVKTNRFSVVLKSRRTPEVYSLWVRACFRPEGRMLVFPEDI